MFGSTLSGLLTSGQEFQSLDAKVRWEPLEVVTYLGIPHANIGPGGDAPKRATITVSTLLDPHHFVPVLRHGARGASTDATRERGNFAPEHLVMSCTPG
jgi:hypothetical protein